MLINLPPDYGREHRPTINLPVFDRPTIDLGEHYPPMSLPVLPPPSFDWPSFCTYGLTISPAVACTVEPPPYHPPYVPPDDHTGVPAPETLGLLLAAAVALVVQRRLFPVEQLR